MSFPWHERAWVEAGDFLVAAVRPGERVLAPDEFWWRLHRIARFVRENLGVPPDFDWIVVQDQDVPALGRPFLESLLATTRPVSANGRFVVFTTRGDVPALDPATPEVAAFVGVVRALPITPTQPLRYEADRAIGAHPTLVEFASLSDRELRDAYETFFDRGGYHYPTARDRAYFDELRGWFERFAAGWTDRRVLDLCCGTSPAAGADDAARLVRVDLAERALHSARLADDRAPSVHYVAADAEELSFADESFDTVAFVDAIEHVRHASVVLGECGRVLAPGGALLVSFTNRNSLNYVINRKLGYPDFGTNHQHIAEFTMDEVTAWLGDAGLEVAETGGIEFRPFLGVPGVDHLVRDALDDDAEVVDLLMEVGRRAGPEYAYVGVVLARKVG